MFYELHFKRLGKLTYLHVQSSMNATIVTLEWPKYVRSKHIWLKNMPLLIFRLYIESKIVTMMWKLIICSLKTVQMFNEYLSIKEINPNIPFYPMKSVVMMLLSRKCSVCIRLDLHKVWVNRSNNFIVTTVRGTW